MERKKENYLCLPMIWSYMQKTINIPGGKKLSELINSAKLKNIKSTCKNQLCFLTLALNNLKSKLRNKPIYNSIKKTKILRNKFNKGVERILH